MGTRGSVFAGLRFDSEQLQEKRESLAKKLALVSVTFLLTLFAAKWFDTQAKISQSVFAPVEPEYFQSLPESVSPPSTSPARTFGFAVISAVFTPQVQYWADDIARWAQFYHLDPNLIATVIQIESCGNPDIVSPKGALGLFQVMPFHFGAGEDELDPQINAARGLTYLRRSFELADGDVRLALAGYNGGHGVIALESTLWPAETRRYVYWGTGILADIASGEATGTRLSEWLGSGGASLCQGAAQVLSSR